MQNIKVDTVSVMSHQAGLTLDVRNVPEIIGINKVNKILFEVKNSMCFIYLIEHDDLVAELVISMDDEMHALVKPAQVLRFLLSTKAVDGDYSSVILEKSLYNPDLI